MAESNADETMIYSKKVTPTNLMKHYLKGFPMKEFAQEDPKEIEENFPMAKALPLITWFQKEKGRQNRTAGC